MSRHAARNATFVSRKRNVSVEAKKGLNLKPPGKTAKVIIRMLYPPDYLACAACQWDETCGFILSRVLSVRTI